MPSISTMSLALFFEADNSIKLNAFFKRQMTRLDDIIIDLVIYCCESQISLLLIRAHMAAYSSESEMIN